MNKITQKWVMLFVISQKPAVKFRKLSAGFWLPNQSKETLTMVRLLSEQSLRPWAIVRILPKAQRCTVARFRNRQDADDHMRLLRRFIPAALFEIIFDSPEEEEQDKQA